MTSTLHFTESSMAPSPLISSVDSSSQSHRIKRKPPPKIQYGPRYPAPDPKDPLASMSELRNRIFGGDGSKSSDSDAVSVSSASLQTPRSSISQQRHWSGFVLSGSPPPAGSVAIESPTPWQGDMFRLSKEYNELSNSSFIEMEKARKRESQQSYHASPARLEFESHSRRRSKSEFGPRSGASSPVDVFTAPTLPPLIDSPPTPTLTPSQSRRTSSQEQFFDAVQFPSSTGSQHTYSDSDLSASSASYHSGLAASRRKKPADAHSTSLPQHHHHASPSTSMSTSSASTSSEDYEIVSTSASFSASAFPLQPESVSVPHHASPEIITPLRSPSPSHMRILEVDMPLDIGRSSSPPPIPIPPATPPRAPSRLSRQSFSSSISMSPLFKPRSQPQPSSSSKSRRQTPSHTSMGSDRLPLPQSTANAKATSQSSSQPRTTTPFRLATSSLSTPSSPSSQQTSFYSKPPTSFPFRVSMRSGHSETSLPRAYDSNFISRSTQPRATESLHSTSLPLNHAMNTLPPRVNNPVTNTPKPRSRSIETLRRGIPGLWRGWRGGDRDRDRGKVAVASAPISEPEMEISTRGREETVLPRRRRRESVTSVATGLGGMSEGAILVKKESIRKAVSTRSVGISLPEPLQAEDMFVSTSLASPPMSPEPYITSFNGHPLPNRGSDSTVGSDEIAGDDVPEREVLEKIARMEVTAEDGRRLQFGEVLGWDLGSHSGKPVVPSRNNTVVIFLRHFWCPNCQDYVSSIMHDIDHDALSRSGVKLVLVGCGSFGLIKSYRRASCFPAILPTTHFTISALSCLSSRKLTCEQLDIFDLPYPIYTDATQQLYNALGLHMTEERSTPNLVHQLSGTHQRQGSRYVKHKSVSAVAMVVRRALKVGMPVWEKGGDMTQLGGEFVFGPDSDRACIYAHRMLTKGGHADIRMVLAAGGFGTPLPSPTSRGSGLWFVSLEEEAAWMEARRRSLARMKEKKEMRRASLDSRLALNAAAMLTTPFVLEPGEIQEETPSSSVRGKNREKGLTQTLSVVREHRSTGKRGATGLDMEWGGSSESMGSVVVISHARRSSGGTTSATSSAYAST